MPWELRLPMVKRPRGGWKFDDTVAGSFDDLVKKVKVKYESELKPTNSVADDICAELSVTDPHLVVFRKGDKPSPSHHTQTVKDWLIRLWRSAATDTLSYTAKERTLVCRACPHRGPNWEDDPNLHPDEVETYKRILKLATAAKSEDTDQAGTCLFWHHDNRAAVWYGNPFASSGCCGSSTRGPDNCWLFKS